MATRLSAWVLAAIGIFAPVTAQAASVSVSNIVFSNKVGHDQGFKWSVEWAPDSRFDLSVGEEAIVIYGALIVHDLPVPPAQAHNIGAHNTRAHDTGAHDTGARDSGARDSGAHDSGNSFQVAFDISPAEGTVSTQGSPVVRFFPGPNSVSVEFDNTPRSFSFGEGGEFLLTFLDSSRVENSGLFLLTAKIELISDSRPFNKPGDKPLEAPVTSAPESAQHARLAPSFIGTGIADF